MAYRYEPRYEWIEWEPLAEELIEEMDFVPFDHSGFRMKVLQNPTNGQVRTEAKSHDALLKGSIEIEDYYRVVAPRIIEWNFEAETEDGKWEVTPAPGTDEDNWQALMLVPFTLVGWIIAKTRMAYLPKAKAPSSKNAGSSDTTASTESAELPTKTD